MMHRGLALDASQHRRAPDARRGVQVCLPATPARNCGDFATASALQRRDRAPRGCMSFAHERPRAGAGVPHAAVSGRCLSTGRRAS